MFTDLFGKAPHARVFDFLADRAGFDHTIMEISKGSGVARPTTYKVVEDLLKQGVLVETRTLGNSRFFKLDLDDDRVQRLLAARDPLAGIGPGNETPRRGRPSGRAGGGVR